MSCALSFIFLILLDLRQCSKPHSKRQQAIWRLECELGIISDPECPIDGGWSPWSPWSPCHGLCDDVGHRTRKRQCNNPPPSKDGIPCSGLYDEIEVCYLSNCTVDDYRKLVERDTMRTRALTQLDAVPALMERCLQMECPFEAVESALAADNTWHLHPESLWNALQCVKHNLGCPVVGEWGPWGTWTVCGARCGAGFRWRSRKCDNPSPSDAHLTCTGTPLQTQQCEGDQCAESDNQEDKGLWSDWEVWSPCSDQCGTGIRRRRRNCKEIQTQQSFEVWGTNCRGQHDQIEVCNRNTCVLDGGWSGWSAWGHCSQTCGAGRRSRTRSCTRPIPAGGGQHCVGSRTEIGTCYLTPCVVYSHTVAVLNGESHLEYKYEKKRSTLFQFYIRFMPLSPHGTLVRRGSVHSPYVRLSLQKWHICLDASGTIHTCDLPRICTTEVIEPAVWHSALITVTNDAATLRIDDSHIAIRSTFPCDPELPNEIMNLNVGERLHGEIQELILNFIPLKLTIDRKRTAIVNNFSPTFVSNIAYEKSNIEEAYLSLDNDRYLRLPCFDSQDEWNIRLTVKSKRDTGTIMLIKDANCDSLLHLTFQNMRMRLKLAVGDFLGESCSTSEYPLNQWLDVQLSKDKSSNIIEAAINSGERLHILFGEEYLRKRRGSGKLNQQFKRYSNEEESDSESVEYIICPDEFFVGGAPPELNCLNSEDITPFSGLIASLSIDGVLQDLQSCNVERYEDDSIQVSSRTASISGSYHETAWGSFNSLNLTCLHTRNTRSPHIASWLFLDTVVTEALRDKKVRSVDDGRVLRLVATADNDLRGFYTCRVHSTRRTRNVITYGVLGKIQYQLSGPDVTTIIAVFTTLTLVLGTLLWLIIEGVHDLRDGFGFFRDAHLSPEEEADAICKYIDDNMDLVGSISEAKLAKAKARRRAKKLSSKSNFAAQEPQGLMEEEVDYLDNFDESTLSEPEGLPALPEIKSFAATEPTHNFYMCEASYISSPRHGSNIISPRSKLTSSASLQMPSPRLLCSRLIMTKQIGSIKRSKSSRNSSLGFQKESRSNCMATKSASCVTSSPAHKILQRFKQLKTDDTIHT